MAWTSAAARRSPPIAQSPPSNSLIRTQVTGRIASPSTSTIAAVTFSIICSFCRAVNTSFITSIVTSGMVSSSCLQFRLQVFDHLAHLSTRAEFDGLVVFIHPDRVPGRPVVDLPGAHDLFVPVRVAHVDGALEHRAPMRTRAQVLRHALQQGRCIRSLREAYARHIEVSPVLGLDADAACLQARWQIRTCMFHRSLLPSVAAVMLRCGLFVRHRPARRLQATWRSRGDLRTGGGPLSYAGRHDLPLRSIRAGYRQGRTPRRRPAPTGGTAGLRAARASGGTP